MILYYFSVLQYCELLINSPTFGNYLVAIAKTILMYYYIINGLKMGKVKVNQKFLFSQSV